MQKRRLDPALDAAQYVKRVWFGVAVIAAVVVAADQLSKTWAEHALIDDVKHVVGSLQFTLTYNRGVAFGVAEGFAPILVALTIIAVLVVMAYKAPRLSPAGVLGVGLVLGGALGNVCDRLFRGHGGAVVDFIDLQWWPIFNLADAAVVSGAVILLFVLSRSDDSSEGSSNGSSDQSASHDQPKDFL